MPSKVRTMIMLSISVIICLLFTIEAFAAVNLNLSIEGKVKYTARDLGAEIAGTVEVNTMEYGSISQDYLTFSAVMGRVDNYGVLTISGTGENYGTFAGSPGETTLNTSTDTIDMYIFIKNVGARPFVPTITTVEETEGLIITVDPYYFNSTQTNPVGLIRSGYTAAQLCTTLDGLTSGTDYQAYPINASVSNGETYFAKVNLSIDPNHQAGVFGTDFDYLIQINLMLDIQYITDENILTVCRENDVADPAWTKLGHNAELSASALKLSTNDPQKLANAYVAGINNNATLSAFGANLTYECDDYDDAVVYQDIDVVNVDINTGEIIGKLSDLDYPFEWCGGTVTLPAGSVLESGRTLSAQETFTVDVYTYYPTMYVRRWKVGNFTYLSVTDQDYTRFGFVKIDAHYVATCEAVTYNPNRHAAYNSYGLITRSYISGFSALTYQTNNFLESLIETEPRFSADGQATTVNPTQEVMLGWADNLTKQWTAYATANPTMAPYTQQIAKGVAGHDWHEFVYQMLYLIKYANNNSQTTVGYGTTSGVSAYGNLYKSNINSTYTAAVCKAIASQKTGGTIGVYNSSKDSSSGTFCGATYNDAHMLYGYDCTTPYIEPDFLTYNNTERRILRDGFVGTDKYTSVCCLGKFNPWGSVFTWVCGVDVAVSGNLAYAFVQFDDYDTTNYYMQIGTSLTFDQKETTLLSYGYVKASYSIPITAGYYRYYGVSNPTTNSTTLNALLLLVGIPDSSSSAGTTTTGLCDNFYTRSDQKTQIYGLCVGNNTGGGDYAGLFSESIRNYINHIYCDIGFRTRLLPS